MKHKKFQIYKFPNTRKLTIQQSAFTNFGVYFVFMLTQIILNQENLKFECFNFQL